MRIHRADFVEGASRARGVVIVIDVFRACSLIAHALLQGAREIIPVADIDTARALKSHWPEALLVGERYARPLPGFDCGNSPSLMLEQSLRGRQIIHTTHAGTQGLTAAATVADRVFTGAFVNFSATVAAVRALSPPEVTIVAMGHEARERCAEDDLCRDELQRALESSVTQSPVNSVADRRHHLRAQLRSAPAAQKFFEAQADWAPEADFDLCTDLDAVPFAVTLQPLSRVDEPVLNLPMALQAEARWALRPGDTDLSHLPSHREISLEIATRRADRGSLR